MKCENCNKEHDGSFGSGRFCCKECAMSWSTKFDNKKETKGGNCSVCGKEIEINKRASSSQAKCDECKSRNNLKINGTKKICKVCGQEKPCIRPDVCSKYRLLPSLSKYFGLDKNKIGTLDIYEEFDRVKNLLIEDYGDNELSLNQIVEKYNHKNVGTLTKTLTSLGINTRSLSEAVKNGIKNERIDLFNNYQYNHGGHTTGNNKQMFYRSSYELDYAQKLDEQQIDYDMENIRVLYGDSQKQIQRVAIPDFHLPETNTIVEIKSSGTYDEQNMKDKFKEYGRLGFHFKLVLEGEEYIG